MDKMLRLLDSTAMRGDDGRTCVVRAYEHLTRLEWGAQAQWESTGLVEYKTDDGRHVEVDASGAMRVDGTRLHPAQTAPARSEKREPPRPRASMPEFARP